MIEVSLYFNALTFDEIDEELVRWLVQDNYVTAGTKTRVYIYPVSIISKFEKTTLYQYQDLQIEQKFIPPADWEFTTRDCKASRRHRLGKIINSIWWGYEDKDTHFEVASKSRVVRAKIDIGIYIESFLNPVLEEH